LLAKRDGDGKEANLTLPILDFAFLNRLFLAIHLLLFQFEQRSVIKQDL